MTPADRVSQLSALLGTLEAQRDELRIRCLKLSDAKNEVIERVDREGTPAFLSDHTIAGQLARQRWVEARPKRLARAMRELALIHDQYERLSAELAEITAKCQAVDCMKGELSDAANTVLRRRRANDRQSFLVARHLGRRHTS